MIGLLWAFLLCASPQDLMSSLVDPKELLANKEQDEADKQFIEDMLKRYAKGTKYVVIGEVLDVRNLESNLGHDREAEVDVDAWLRGTTEKQITIFVPHNAPFIEGQWETVPGKIVKGYSVIIFLDQQYRVVEGNAIFYTDGENLWRNKRPNLFLHPSYDREWVDQNPYDDYLVFPLSKTQSWLDKKKLVGWIRD